jgi:hypothetical protein
VTVDHDERLRSSEACWRRPIGPKAHMGREGDPRGLGQMRPSLTVHSIFRPKAIFESMSSGFLNLIF